MKLTDIFVKRPVLAICANVLILVAGLQAIYSLNTRQYPRSDVAVVTVRTVYVGASADLVRGFVTTPLERVVASADGIDYLESSSEQGLSTITAHLRLNYDTNDALTQIQSKVAQVRNDLPPEAEAPTIEVQNTDNQFASMYLSFFSAELESNQITDYLTRVVQPKLSAVKGVQKADILGARTFAMRIWLKPDKMAALGISPTEVQHALAANNYLSAVGSTKGSMIRVNLIANTDLQTEAEFRNLVIKESGTALVRLGDIADVVLGAEDYNQDVRFGGETATFVGVWVLPNANSLEVIQSVREVLPEIEKDLPSGMKLGVPYDATRYIEDSIHEVLKTLSETILIVILVIYLFIGSLRSVLIPVVAIPLSLIGAAALMYLFGFTLNLLTLLAIVLAVGLVVDDAIVMLENIERHVSEGMKPMQAAVVGARELVGPVIAMTITLAAVYAPIGIQGGLTGTLFKEFAFTLAGAVVVSGIVALTLSPMMCSKILKSGVKKNAFQLRSEHFLERLGNKYESLLRASLHYRPSIVTGSLVLVLLIFPFYMFAQKELAPREDQGVVFGIVQAAPNASLDQTSLFTEQAADIFKSFPEYKTSFQLTNPEGGFSGMVLKPWSERNRASFDISNEAWGKLASLPGVQIIVTTPPPLPGGSNFPIEMAILSTASPEELLPIAEQLVSAAFQSGVFMFADSNLKFDLPQSEIILDRDKIATYGLDLQQIGSDLGVLMGGDYVNRFNIQGRSYKVIPQVKREFRLNPEQLLNSYVTGPNDSLVPLSTIARIEDSVIPRKLNRFQQLNSVTIQGVVVPGASIDQGLKVLEEKAKEILPAGYSIDYAGESRQLRSEGESLMLTLLMAVVLIYLVLAAQFESFRDPFIILAGSVPLALSGALLFTFLGATSLNVYSQVGLVTLVGLVAKNGILIVEFANNLQKKGMNKVDAVISASCIRLRPILMTSVATVVGHFPLILATGAGAGARNSIGYMLVSGMIIGTFFTLFVVPTLYTFIAATHRKDEIEGSDESEPSSIKKVALALIAFSLTSCAIGPDYTAPDMTPPSTFSSLDDTFKTTGEESPSEWWKVFQDEKLHSLVETAVESNKEIAMAVSRVNQSRALARETFVSLFPGGQLTGNYTENQFVSARFPGFQEEGGAPENKFKLFSVGADALWEIDIFGKTRREIEVRDAEKESSVALLKDTLRIVIAEVAQTYFQLRGTQHELAVAEQNAKNQEKTVALVQERERIGVGTELDTVRAEAQLSATRASLFPLEAAVQNYTHRISVLLGKQPQELKEELKNHTPLPEYRGPLHLGNPSMLLRRRPDLQTAERKLAAATADIGVATGDLFPVVTFEGSLSWEANPFSRIGESGTQAYSWGPRITWGILSAGQIAARIKAASARADESLKTYEQSVLLALEETENALTNLGAEQKRRAELEVTVQASRRALEIAKAQYEIGASDFLTVLEAQREALKNEGDLARSKTQYALTFVSLYKALGGGWENYQLVEE